MAWANLRTGNWLTGLTKRLRQGEQNVEAELAQLIDDAWSVVGGARVIGCYWQPPGPSRE
eukprot:5401782-Amphidinium_carterae.1